MTAKEKDIESLLLRERWNLIQNSTDHKVIKIYNHLLYVNKKLYGEVKDSKFHYINSKKTISIPHLFKISTCPNVCTKENSTVTTLPANPSTPSIPSDHTN